MSRIEDTLTQDAIADSLLGDTAEQAPESQADNNTELLADLSTDRGQYSQEETQQLAQRISQPGERFENVAERQALERVLEQPQERAEQQSSTPEQIMEEIGRLDSFVKENNLNDSESARTFASDFCAAFGRDAFASGVNVEAMGNVMAKTASSAVATYLALQQQPGAQLPGFAPESAKAFAYDFIRACGQDPRAVNVDSQMLAETVFAAAINFVDTYNKLGGSITNLDRLNDPKQAEFFYAQFMRAFGVNEPVNRQAALKLADAGGKYLLSFMGKLGQIQNRGGNQQTTGGRKGGGRKPAAPRRSPFKTNQDIFDADVMDKLEIEKIIAGDRGGFAGSPSRNTQRFKTNTDIFDADTMEAFNGRL